jgi:Spy/CpxP family protein refolding chaperone
MKYAAALFIAALMLMASSEGAAQRRGMMQGPGMDHPGRLQKFKMMRLVETLKLSEEDAVRFYAKNSAHEDKVREMMQLRNSKLDQMEETVRDKKEGRSLQAEADSILAIDQQIFSERVRYQGEVRKLLSPEQFAKYLVYERTFGRGVRGAMEEMRRGRGDKGSD